MSLLALLPCGVGRLIDQRSRRAHPRSPHEKDQNLLLECAYAGLFFDLVGAIYSALMVNGFEPALLIMFVAVGAVLASYFLWHELQKGLVAGPAT